MKKEILLIFILFINSCILLSQPGSLDLSFNSGLGANSYIIGCKVQTDGKILIGGNFTSFNGTSINHLARLNSTGSLDTTFNVGAGADNNVNDFAIQVDGKVIIVGAFANYNGISYKGLARLNSDGTIDTTFKVGTGANFSINKTIIQPDGKIIIGGYFTNYNGVTMNHLARLNPNGSIDTSFNIGIGANAELWNIELQSDGKIIICGNFTTYDSFPINRISRLNPNGSMDLSFNVGLGANNSIRGLSIQSDGKIVIAGAFTTFNGLTFNRITRLNNNGTIDSTFNVGLGPNLTSLSCGIQSDGKILVSGNHTSFNASSSGRIARLNTNGTLDVAFNSVIGANNYIPKFVIQNDGKIIIVGAFTSYDGIIGNRIVRLSANFETSSAVIDTNPDKGSFVFPNPNNGLFKLFVEKTLFLNNELIQQKGSLKITNSLGFNVYETFLIKNTMNIDLTNEANGLYLIEINTNRGTNKIKIIKN